MAESSSPWGVGHAEALQYAWGEYRTWAATSRQKKRAIFGWRYLVLAFTIAGTILVALGGHDPKTAATSPFSLSVLGGICAMLAAYFAKEILSPGHEREWVRARSTAEALKSEIYLFRTQTAPYSEPDAPERFREHLEGLLNAVEDICAALPDERERLKGLETTPLSLEEYLEKRLGEQIGNFYEDRVRKYQSIMALSRYIALFLGAVAAVLTYLGTKGSTGTWAAVITTTTAAISAFVFAARYQYLLVSYQATARQLKSLRVGFGIAYEGHADKPARDKFIRECEDVISIENNAWMAKWSDRKTSAAKQEQQKPQLPTEQKPGMSTERKEPHRPRVS